MKVYNCFITVLRVCTQKENSYNNRGTKLNKKVKGVSWLKVNKKWTARIIHNYKTIHLGNYFTYAEAVLARVKKNKSYLESMVLIKIYIILLIILHQ